MIAAMDQSVQYLRTRARSSRLANVPSASTARWAAMSNMSQRACPGAPPSSIILTAEAASLLSGNSASVRLYEARAWER
jgi:hypothetical protein